MRHNGKIARKRAHARKVRLSDRPSASPVRSSRSRVPGAFAALFVLCIVAAVLGGRLQAIVLAVYAAASVVAFVVYALDKSAARHNQRRTPETTLHLISLAGGWPGALLAQKVIRHKSSKVEFQRVFWMTVAVNCVVLVILMTPWGIQILRDL